MCFLLHQILQEAGGLFIKSSPAAPRARRRHVHHARGWGGGLFLPRQSPPRQGLRVLRRRGPEEKKRVRCGGGLSSSSSSGPEAQRLGDHPDAGPEDVPPHHQPAQVLADDLFQKGLDDLRREQLQLLRHQPVHLPPDRLEGHQGGGVEVAGAGPHQVPAQGHHHRPDVRHQLPDAPEERPDAPQQLPLGRGRHPLQLRRQGRLEGRPLQRAPHLGFQIRGRQQLRAPLPQIPLQVRLVEERAHDGFLDGLADLLELARDDPGAVHEGDAVEEHLDGQPVREATRIPEKPEGEDVLCQPPPWEDAAQQHACAHDAKSDQVAEITLVGVLSASLLVFQALLQELVEGSFLPVLLIGRVLFKLVQRVILNQSA
mmetsp:Transcript_10064/g.14092  ORF Transcript_10064/g.14092 Transcript_10064/m.14092 type:complete len:371 (-) Transcript_10064:117-1229(-)